MYIITCIGRYLLIFSDISFLAHSLSNILSTVVGLLGTTPQRRQIFDNSPYSKSINEIDI